MNKLAKILFFAIVLTFLPMKHWAQTPYRQYADNGILLDFHKIDNVDFRVFLMYNLSQDGQFVLTPNEEYGQFSVSWDDARSSERLMDAFDSYYADSYADFQLFTKNELLDLIPQWKDAVAPTNFLSIMMDVIMRNGRPTNNHCIDSDPFCTSDVITFDAASTSQTADQLENDEFDDGCIGSSYNPSWYHMRINDPGQFIIHMEGHDPSDGTNRDIDFCMWGPFHDPTSPCVAQLTSDKIIDCNYSSSYSEDIYMGYQEDAHYHSAGHGTVNYHDPQSGEYYILLITNYSRQPCTISFTKTENSGPGTTDCGILPGVVSNDGPYCVGETINLTVNQQFGATYSWTGPNGFTSSQQNPVRPNCTLDMGGNYTCVTTVGGESTTATTTVTVFDLPEANFEATMVCVGNPTMFNSTASTSDQQEISTYEWDFGDGTTGSGENVSHTYAEPGTYSVTHHVSTRACEGQVTLPVVVVAAPVASFTATTVCQGEATQFTSTSTGDQISGFQWNFGDGQTGTGETVSHTYTQAGNFQVTLTAEGSGGTCSGTITQSVTVYAMPAPVATANPYSVQYSEASTITVNPGAEGNFTYHWEPADMVTDPNSQTTQTVPLTESQTYTVTVTNTQGGCTSTTYVTVSMDGSDLTATATADQYEICDGSSTTLHAIPAGGTGNYSFSWTPAATLSNPTSMNPVASPAVGTTTYSCHITDGIIDQNVSVSITVHPNKSTDINRSICDGTSYNFFGQNLTEAGVYHHTLQTLHGCDSVINLYLEKMQVFETTLSDYFCEGDTYTFFGQQLSAPGTYSHTMQTQQGCDSIVKLNLSLSPVEHSQFTVPDGENCDSYFWDPQGHQIVQTDHDGLTYTNSGTYHRTYLNHAGCDSIVTMNVRFEYTPDPTPIYPMDEANTAPHWVVSATEFQINTYDFQLWDNNPLCYWDTVTWTLEGATDWFTEPFGNKAKQCKVYVLSQVEDTVWLTARAFNRCSPGNGVERRYWLVCSFYGIDEQEADLADFSVVPNPNNGQMTLNFEHLTGKVNVKVYNMQGALIDDFEAYNGQPAGSYTYSMKDKADGIYFFVASGREGTKAKKVVIQH